MRIDGLVENRAVYVAIGITPEGQKEGSGAVDLGQPGREVLAAGADQAQQPGGREIFIACADGLTGFPQAIETVYPKTTAQLCIVHMLRARLNLARLPSWL
jgi:putative transposase